MGSSTAVAKVRFQGTLSAVGKRAIVRLPESASRKLPSRGQVAVEASIGGHVLETVLEPDGYFGHWMRVEDGLQRAAGLRPGDELTVEVEPVQRWPEPSVPEDLGAALASAPQTIRDLWEDITPMARWEWVRWVNATGNPDTRRRRVEVTISKMNSGKRRPCCFNLASCTDTELARSGKLIRSA